MKDFLDKLSTYNIFNYLLPGILFAVIIGKITPFVLLQEDILVGVFLYYFLGMIISRFGSLVIEPILKKVWFKKKWAFVHFVDYRKFVAAEKIDQKIELLSEVNNTYRTLLSLFVLLLLVKLYSVLAITYSISQENSNLFAIFLLLFLFAISYKKQTRYVKNRVEACVTSKEEGVIIKP